MRIFYTLSIQLYFLAISLTALFGKKKAKQWLNGRQKWQEKLEGVILTDKSVAWFHAASLGEFEQARSLIEKVKKEQPHYFILLTFFSPSGYEVRKDYSKADFVCYLPLDTIKNAKKFLKIVQPKIAVFVKYEFWFNLLKVLNKQEINTILISGIFRENQHFFKAYGGWFRKHLKAFNHFYVQNEISQQLLEGIGHTNVSVVGDTRFDRVVSLAEEKYEDQRFESFSENNKVIVFGSSWSTENEVAIELSKLGGEEKIIIAPHEINASKIEKLKQALDGQVSLFSETKEDQDLSGFKVLIIDQIGLLSKIYRFASIAVIGGGFGAGIHNTLEAAVYGCSVLFGPNYQKFQEAQDLLKKGGAYSAKDKTELLEQIQQLLNDDEKNEHVAKLAQDYVKGNAGATTKIAQESFS